MDVIESISELLNIQNPVNGQTVYVKSYYSGQSRGGGHFIYDSAKSTQNDSGTIFNGWVRQLASNVLNPYMFGAYGDLVFTTPEVLDYASGHDDTQAFKNMLNMNKYVIHTNISKAISSNIYSKYTFEIPHGSYYITDTLPIRTNTKIEGNNSTLFFNPSSKKDMWSTPREEMAAAYQISTGWNTQTIGMVEISNLIMIGNVSRVSDATLHAGKCLDGGNAYKWRLENLIIERFDNGVSLYGIDTSPWTNGKRIGNFYENVVENVAIQECIQGFYNTSNVLQASNLTVGGGNIVGVQRKHKFDYMVINKGAGSSFNGFNIAPPNQQNMINALIYDACHGSYWGGGYSEWFNILFDLEMQERFDGFKFDASHLFKHPEDICVRFVPNTYSTFDPATGVRTPSRHFTSGRQNNEYLNHSGFEFGAGASLITNFFKFFPQADFKYGLYGCAVSSNELIYDVLRYQSVHTGFTTKYGIRLINPTISSIDIVIPINTQSVQTKVCMLYRSILGNFNHANLKSNAWVNSSNERISLGEVMYDYNNGWKMAACEITSENASEGNVTITIPANSQVEIEHIGAYSGGVPFMPTYADYEPRVGDLGNEWIVSDTTGGTFETNDVFRAHYNTATAFVSDGLIVSRGHTHSSRYNIASNAILNIVGFNAIDTSTSNVVSRVGIGSRITLNSSQYDVVGRVYENGSYSKKLIVSGTSALTTGTVSVPVGFMLAPSVRDINAIGRRNVPYSNTLEANEIKSTDITLERSTLGAPVIVGTSPSLGASSRMWAEVISNGNVRLYHQNLTAASLTTNTIVTLKIV
ncbi:hypothetical protein RMB13_20540 [Acinetobacter sp. V102_4]|uniref:hypothetical protein n=1 Tax=Acinetobacter sp. V102_4 TaxID=3072984 RepID=UPI00287D61CE|nr:hypothetical protein [Acinetobacter sp. V102_4]MDS7931828.1 hypothetical protein [Acinetobacter sp. V102_4]